MELHREKAAMLSVFILPVLQYLVMVSFRNSRFSLVKYIKIDKYMVCVCMYVRARMCVYVYVIALYFRIQFE